MPSKAVVFVVAAFLIVGLIYGPTAKGDVLALKHIVGTRHCATTNYNPGGGTTQTCCWQEHDVDSNGNTSNEVDYCQSCDYTSSNAIISCDPSYIVRSLPAGALAPGNLTNAPPSNTGKTGGVLNPIGIPTNAPPTSNSTGTPPSVSIIKVPPGTINSAGNATIPSNSTGTPPTALAGCGPGTDNSTCSTTTSNSSAAPPTALAGCGPGTDNSTCSTTSNPQSTPPTSGCGPGTDNSTCSSTSTPNSQLTHKGSNLGQTGASTSGGNSTK